MELAFVEKKVRDLCARRAPLDRLLGPERAEVLRHRLADLRAARSIHDLLLEPPCPIDDSGRMALSVAEGLRIVFCPNHRQPAVDADGKIDWSRVSRLKIIDIEGAHD
jgi:toxin HigB-1